MNTLDSSSELNPDQPNHPAAIASSESTTSGRMATEPIGSADSPTKDAPTQPSEPPPSYVKLAMRNMVRKRGLSLFHFTLTTLGLLGFLVGMAYLTR